MAKSVYIDGSLVPADQATVSVFDHGLLYGDGVFEGIRVYGGNVFLLSEHVDRLYESAQAIRLQIPIPHEELVAAVNETVQANDIVDGYAGACGHRGILNECFLLESPSPEDIQGCVTLQSFS